MNQFNKFPDFGLVPNPMNPPKYPPTESQLPKSFPNPFESKDHNPLFPMDMGADPSSLYYKSQQMMEKEKESPSKSVSSSNIVYPEYLKTINYYHEFWLMYLQNEIIIAKMKEYVGEIKNIQKKIEQFEGYLTNIENNGMLDNSGNQKNTKKKKRRTAAEIQKEFECPYNSCKKTYGSDVSLNLHIKLKHGGGNKTEREKLARKYILSKLNGEENFDLPSKDLPTGYLENFYAFHKNKRKKNFDLKHLHDPKDPSGKNSQLKKNDSDSNSMENSSIMEKSLHDIKEEAKTQEMPKLSKIEP